MLKILRWCRTAGSFILSAVLLISALALVMGAAPADPIVLTPYLDSGLVITSKSGRNFMTGWEIPPTGSFTAAHYLEEMAPAPAGYTQVIFHGSQLNNAQLAAEDIVSTGDEMRLVRGADGQVVHRASIVITGDALGIGTMNINQVYKIGSLMGTTVGTDPYQMAADMNSDGKIDADDFRAAAALLAENSGGAGETVNTAPISLTPGLDTVPSGIYTVQQGDKITFRIESNAISTDALIDVDPTQLRYEGNTGLGTGDHLLLTTAGNGEYADAEYTYTVLAKPGSMVPFTLTHTVVQMSEEDTEPLSVASDPWTFVEVVGDTLSYSPEACPTIIGPETIYVGEEIELQVVTPADASDCLAQITTSGLEFQGVTAPDGAADSSTSGQLNWYGGSRVLTYKYKVTAQAGETVRFVLHDSIAHLTKYDELVAGGQTSWNARADAGTAHPMITLKKPNRGSLQASWMAQPARPTLTPAPSLDVMPAPAASATQSAAGEATATPLPTFMTTNQDVSFRTYTKGDYVSITATPSAGYVLSTLTAVSGDQMLTYNRQDPTDGTGRFGSDGRFYVLSKTNNKVALRFTVPALDVVVTANFITAAEAEEQDQALPSPSPSVSPSPSPSPSGTLTPDPSESPAPSESPSSSATPDPSGSPSAAASDTAAPTESPSATASDTAAPTESPSAMASETVAPTQQPSPSLTPPRSTWTPSPTPAPTERWNFELPTDSGLRIGETNAGMPYITGRDLQVSSNGLYVGDFAAQIAPPPSGTVKVMTEDGREVAPAAYLATGQVLEARSASGDLMDHAFVVLKGDVLGTGEPSIAQLTTVANAVLGNTTLTGLRKEAADMNMNGRLDIADLVAVAHTIHS